MQKETGIKLAIVGAAACAAVYALTATNTGSTGTSLYTAMDPIETEFINFVAKYRRNFGTKEEYNFRLQQFKNTAAKIGHFQAQNADSTSTVGINLFSDWTPEEYKKLLGFKPLSESALNETMIEYVPSTNGVSNGNRDWRNEGKVTGVKDQGQCGSCWAFSSTGALEAHHAIKSNQLIALSEQQLVDCNLENGGCNGGWMDQAFSYSAQQPLQDEGSYPYQAARIGCRYRGSGYVAAQKIWKINSGDNNSLRSAIQNQGPVSVAIEADRAVFQSYRGGVINSADCGTSMDHAVLVVGYADGYWIVKNSWTANWGEGGYVRIADVGGAGICGINQHAVFPETN